jgi:hypothetical protein
MTSTSAQWTLSEFSVQDLQIWAFPLSPSHAEGGDAVQKPLERTSALGTLAA